MRELLGWTNALFGGMIFLGVASELISPAAASIATACVFTPMTAFMAACLMFMFIANAVALLWED